MKSLLQPWQFLLLILAGWINSRQQEAIDYLLTENRILREKLGKKRILLNDGQRRRLAIRSRDSAWEVTSGPGIFGPMGRDF